MPELDDDDPSKPLIDLSAYTRKIPSNFDAGRRPPGVDPTPDNPHSRARARTLPKMGGDQPRLPKMALEVPEMVDNPAQAGFEPATIDVERPLSRPDYARTAVRRVVPAEIDWVIEWGLPRFQRRFPRCTAQSIWPMLNAGCQGGPMYFVRTESACGLFVADRTAWEPELFVSDVFVVKKREGATEERDAIYRAGLRWAEEIGAVTFQFGAETGVKLDEIAQRLGCDIPIYGYVKVLR